MGLKADCNVCGSSLEYESQCTGSASVSIDEQQALTQWLAAHDRCRAQAALRAQAAIAAFPVNLARAGGLEALEDKRRERAAADSIRDADVLLDMLTKPS